MIVAYTSIEEVIGRIIRNTRIQDSYYILSMNEWIPEAMGYMRTKVELQTCYKDLRVNFHKVGAPVNLIAVKAIEWNGSRLKYGNDVRAIDGRHSGRQYDSTIATTGTYLSVPIVHSNPTNEDSSLIYDSTALPPCFCYDTLDGCNSLPCCDAYYNTELGYINTSFSDGWVRAHYTRMALDGNGMPFIPDDEDYKQALYYYVRAMMGGAGWDDPVFKYEQLMQHYEIHAARAMGKIRYPSVDQMEMKVNNHRRLVVDEGYYDRFFSSPTEERTYGHIEYGLTPGYSNLI